MDWCVAAKPPKPKIRGQDLKKEKERNEKTTRRRKRKKERRYLCFKRKKTRERAMIASNEQANQPKIEKRRREKREGERGDVTGIGTLWNFCVAKARAFSRSSTDLQKRR